MAADIDKLIPTRGLIDLSSHSSGDFGLEGYELKFLFDDIVLVELVDLSESGDTIMRNGLHVPTNAVRMAWRKGKVMLKGPRVAYANVGDIVTFPSNMGVAIANIKLADGETVKNGMFLNEARMFGICAPLEIE